MQGKSNSQFRSMWHLWKKIFPNSGQLHVSINFFLYFPPKYQRGKYLTLLRITLTLAYNSFTFLITEIEG
nr:MAG TPA: hypothetical protein [Caudoviricetes sp.]DAS85798.1 MAG TPA: hypothetical protein [Caudoviricetes sp.]